MPLSNSDTANGGFLFANEDTPPKAKNTSNRSSKPWKVLIVDDEPSIHEITKLSLKGFDFGGRSLQFLNAHSKKEAKEILEKEDDIAVALVDVVMEDDKAGLDLIQYIRETLNNKLIRLVLRTGQPGQAPEKKVIREYDINDYKEKTELTAQKLYSTIYTSIRSYRDMVALDNNRKGLEHIIHASTKLFTTPVINEFVQGMLEQLIALLYLGEDAVFLDCESIAYERETGEPVIVAGTGKFAGLIGKNPAGVLDEHVFSLAKEAHNNKRPVIREKEFASYFKTHDGREDVIYITSDVPFNENDLSLIEIFLHNVCIAYENVILQNEIEGTQRDMLYTLGESIETRSKETGQHVRRVSEYCKNIALGLGLTERDAEILEIASPLHDLGKIGIPDHILNKPGKLNEEEWEIMKTHASIGECLLGSSKREILKAASIIAGQHHEKWNGSGYPRALKGESIHIYGRIVAIADVYDALGSRRCYKEAWPIDKIVSYLQEQRGEQFDPQVVDWVIQNIDVMNAIRAKYPD